MENIENVRLFVKSLDNTTDQLKESLEPILKKTLDELVAQYGNDDQIEKIRVYNNYAYTLVSLLFAYLKSVGVNTDTHPVVKELARVKTYMKRMKQLESGALNEEQQQKKDAEKAKEYLQNALGGKINGGGAAASDTLKGPAISSSNFTGTHTKFEDKEEKPKQKSKSPAKDGRVKKPKKSKK